MEECEDMCLYSGMLFYFYKITINGNLFIVMIYIYLSQESISVLKSWSDKVSENQFKIPGFNYLWTITNDGSN